MDKVYGVIGDPIGHSLSPLIHNYSFTHEKIKAIYHAFLVKQDKLETAVQGMKALGISGFNVTIPHKEAIIPCLDDVDPLAKQIGAVNTVVNKKDTFIGYNTDGIGFVKGLRQSISEPAAENKKVLIIGAGGAARGIYFTLLEEGFSFVDITNRSVERAQQLILDCQHQFSSNSKALTLTDAEENLEDYDILIQTTSVGMAPKVDDSPLLLHKVKKGTYVFDIIYNPFETKLLRLAKEKGCSIHNGIDMFIYQAAFAFQLWTGIWPNTNEMKKIVIDTLGGSLC